MSSSPSPFSGTPFIGVHRIAFLRRDVRRYTPFRRDLELLPVGRSEVINLNASHLVIGAFRPGIFGFRGSFTSLERLARSLQIADKALRLVRISYFNWYYFREIRKASLSTGLRDIVADRFRAMYAKNFRLPTDTLRIHPLLDEAHLSNWKGRTPQIWRLLVTMAVLGTNRPTTAQAWVEDVLGQE